MLIAKNMKLRKRQVLKAVAGAILVLLAAFVTVFVRDSLYARNPENALPTMVVYFDNNGEQIALPSIHSTRDAYEWRFSFWPPVTGGGFDLEPWRELVPGKVNRGAKLELEFSFTPKEVRVYAAAGESGYVPVNSDLHAPSSKGNYAYKVVASWGANRTVTYYFRIEVPW